MKSRGSHYTSFVSWCHQESNRGHKDFQSFALPTELWHLVSWRVQRCVFYLIPPNFVAVFFLSQIRYRVQRCDKFRIETSRGVLKFRFLPGIWFGSASVCSVCTEIREPVPVLQNRRNPILTDISCLLRRKLLPRSCYVFTKVAMKGDKIACRTAFEWLLV